MPYFIQVMKYRQKRDKLKRALSLVLRILVILHMLIDLIKKFPY